MKRWILTLWLLTSCSSAQIDWSGRWEYGECWPDLSGQVSNCVSYKLNIHPAENKYVVDIDMDGFQTMERIRAEGQVNQNELRIVFREFREQHLGPEYMPGDILLILENAQGKILTKWEKISPSLETNAKPGSYFVRDSKS